MKYFSSDWHLSHQNVLSWSNRPFDTIEEMNETIIENMIKPLKRGDELYFLGDMSWKIEPIKEFFERFPRGTHIHMINGNHERWVGQFKHRYTSISNLKEIKIGGNHTTLCHYPMLAWNKSHYNAFSLFGHIHKASHRFDKLENLTKGKTLNVNVEFHDYKPWSEDEIIAYMKTEKITGII